MKALIISDIHGSAQQLEKALAQFERLQPDFLFILGDVLYHGPRNPLPGGHNPMRVAELLNGLKDKIIAVRGNCDAEIDQAVLKFPCSGDYAIVEDAGADEKRMLFLTHGHLYERESFPFDLPAGSVVFSGHTHVSVLETDPKTGITWCNPGSISLPKGGLFSTPSYAEYIDGKIEVKELGGD
ncbi:MAG: phosphodiesterase [Spirochaetaceae bacterium]|jgi:putative phosphoesterase|nr:phosphodiesterase [Spirochaetaceae bacterium]